MKQLILLFVLLIATIIGTIYRLKESFQTPVYLAQTHKHKIENIPIVYKDAIISWKKQPGFQYVYYDDIACKKFLQMNFGKLHTNIFESIKIGAFKGDFFRYCWQYKMGGIYADIDSVCLVDLEKWLKQYPTVDIILARDDPSNKRAFYQAFIYCRQPNNKLMYNCIEKVIDNVSSYRKGATFDKFSFTGPGLVYEEFVKLEPKYAGKDLPTGIINTSFGNMLILTWNVPALTLIDDKNRPIVKHKCDNCYDGIYWFDQASQSSWV